MARSSALPWGSVGKAGLALASEPRRACSHELIELTSGSSLASSEVTNHARQN
jgi:hypothetical protein